MQKSSGPLRTLKRLALPAIVTLLLLYLAYLKRIKHRNRALKLAKKMQRDIKICQEIIQELEVEVNFVIKVAYLKFQE